MEFVVEKKTLVLYVYILSPFTCRPEGKKGITCEIKVAIVG
jgi:hypothetical protein